MLEQFAQIPDKEKAEMLESIYLENEDIKRLQKELQEIVNVEYRYIRNWDIWPHKCSSISFGWKREGDEIVYAVALQSRKDNFCRRYARNIINKRFSIGATQKFKFVSNTPIRDMGPILAAHYNSLREVVGIENVPKYLRHIPIYLGE